MARKEDAKTIGKVIAEAWRNEEFKQRLLASPVQVLKEAGLEVPKGSSIRVVQDTPQLRHFVLPVKPPGLNDAEMEAAAKGLCSVQ